jgi:hypothetical protein
MQYEMLTYFKDVKITVGSVSALASKADIFVWKAGFDDSARKRW